MANMKGPVISVDFKVQKIEAEDGDYQNLRAAVWRELWVSADISSQVIVL